MNTSMKREISCLVTRSLLMYVREVSDNSLDHFLNGLDLDEQYLLDSNNWVSHAFLQTLYKRMINILGDDRAVYKMALASERIQSFGLIDRVVRLFGNPRLVYAQAPKYNKLLKTIGDIYIREWGDSWLILEDRYHKHNQKTRYDCDYTRGVLAGIPTMFNMPTAHVEEIECQISQDDYGNRIWEDKPLYGSRGCLYKIRYGSRGIAPLWKRLFNRKKIYQKAIDDLLEANRTIQEKYEEVKRLAADLKSVNNELIESKQRLEANTKDLMASEKRYRLLAENVTDIIWLFDIETMRFTYVSPSVKKARGFTPEEAMAQDLTQTLSPESCARVISTLEKELRNDRITGTDKERSRSMEIQHSIRDGGYTWVEATMTFIRNENGMPEGIQGVSRNIDERKRAEEALNAEKERLAVTLQSIGDGVITTDRDGKITLINRIAKDMTGWPESDALGRSLEDVFRIINEETRQPCENPVKSVIESGKIVGPFSSSILISRDSSEYNIADSAAPILDTEKKIIGVVLVFRDMTRDRKMKKELLKFEKLESLGVLAGGIAHDFNNFLSGIIGNISLCKLEIKPEEKIFQRLDDMENASSRAKDLTQQLLTFSKGGDPVKIPRRLNDLVKESATFAVRGSNVRCESDLPYDLYPSEVDEAQLSQVISNLCINAIQSMPDGGTIHVTGRNVILPHNNELSLRTGKYVRLTIEDQGIGIEKENIKKIFDPYFTTKETSSGLGLAVVYSIIEKHSGRITVDSTFGSGTLFSIFLPATDLMNVKSEEQENCTKPGAGKVLVMDDEDFIRDLTSEMLDKLGYEATLTVNGEEAICSYKEALESGRAFDAVILDLTVPGGMGGKETMKKLLEIDSNVKAIVSSGYSNDPVMSNYGEYGFQKAVKKPFRVHELSEALHSILNEPTST